MFQRRLRVVYILMCAGLLVLCGRLFYLQVLQVTDMDPDRRLNPPASWQTMPAARGTLRDRNGVVLAEDRPTLDLAVHYRNLRLVAAADPVGRMAGLRFSPARELGPQAWLAEVCAVAGKNPEEVLTQAREIVARITRTREIVEVYRRRHRLRKINRIYEETVAHTLIRNIPLALAARVEANPTRYPGVVVRTDPERIYPMKQAAVQALGYVKRAQRPRNGGPIHDDPTIVPGDRVGARGVERRLDRWLRGRPGYYEMRTDRKTGERTRKILWPAHPGRTVTLTLHAQAQEQTEAAFGNHEGGAVVMDVKTGEVLVIASVPRYDNNNLAPVFREAARRGSTHPFLSRAMQDSVASGSVIKPIIALAGARKGVCSPATTITCHGSIRFGRRRPSCSGIHGPCDLTRAILKSCNIWFYRVGQRTDGAAIAAMLREFGWGAKTGIDLPQEWGGFVPRPGPGWSAGSTLNLSIGQGNLRVTPLQVAVGMAAIANGGDILQPRILRAIDPMPEDLPPEEMPNLSPRVIRRLDLNASALSAIRTGMRRAALRGGTAAKITELAALKAACKTGTAQIGRRDINYAWIAGYAPHDAPRYAFAVVVHRVPLHGGEAAGPIAAKALGVLLGANP